MVYRVTVVGATGAVGREMLKTLAERQFPVGEVAAVAAETAAIAEDAATLIDVEYAELPAVFDAAEAMQEGAPLLHENLAGYINAPRPMPTLPNTHSHVKWQLGDAAAGFAESDFVFEQTFDLPPQLLVAAPSNFARQARAIALARCPACGRARGRAWKPGAMTPGCAAALTARVTR